MSKIRIDWGRAELVFGTLLDAIEHQVFPYDFARPPQLPENLPKGLVWGSLEHARFLMCCCYYMRGGIKSDRAIRALSRAYENFPDYFSPEKFLWPFVSEEDKYACVTQMLKSVTLGYNADEVGMHWVKNFQKLHKHWKGNPAELFVGVESYDDLCSRIIHSKVKHDHARHGFYGFREKMVSMLTYFLMDAKIIPECVFPVPVDFHVLRMLVSHQILVVEGAGVGDNVYSDDLLAAARELTQTYCKKHNVETIKLGDTLWLLSGNICSLNPGNKVFAPKERNGRQTTLTLAPVTWSDTQVSRYKRSCANCPVKSTCRYNIPSAFYYVRGQLYIRSVREEPLLLFVD